MNKTLLLCFVAWTAVAGTDRARYLAPRLDGEAGSGTVTDPFNASDAGRLWQAWLKSAYRKDGVSVQTITFLPGVYSVTNELRLPYDAKDVTVTGYGARLVFTDQALQGQRTILCTSWGGNDDVTWEGFMLDCGSAVRFAGNGKVCGVYSRGRNNVVRNVTVRNLAVYNKAPFSSGYHETFGIVLYSDGGICSGNVLAGTGGGESQGLTGIAVSGNDCVVSGNVVDFRDDSPTNEMTSFGFSAYGSRLVFSGNVARGVDAAISMDGAGSLENTNTWEGNVIIGNVLTGNEMSVRIENNSQSYRDWLWVGNNFNARGRSWVSMWTSQPAWRSNSISGQRFVGNLFSGEAQKENLLLSNFREPHVFIGNEFSAQPRINPGTNKNTIFGSDNTVRGTPNNSAFGRR